MAKRAQYTSDPTPEDLPVPAGGDGGKAIVRNVGNTAWEMGEVGGGVGGLTVTDIKTGAYTAVVGERVKYDGASAYALTTPATRADGDKIAFHSVTAGAFAITITADGSDTVGDPYNFGIPAASYVTTAPYFHVEYQFDSASSAWLIL